MTKPDDPFGLERFLIAQEGVFDRALAEMRAGAKRSHWMWFIFPQLAGLGRSAMAEHYAIGSRAEARAYLAHPVLGARYRNCVDALAALAGADARRVFGSVDALKLCSSLTLFAAAGGGAAIERELRRWCARPDPATLELLAAAPE
ncbi:MAG: DUF1810 domain-containing protein [Sphingomonadaceae bacterium]|nr:DUF1810 domain-containing protein [Sphingomonadaceae bacterium]